MKINQLRMIYQWTIFCHTIISSFVCVIKQLCEKTIYVIEVECIIAQQKTAVYIEVAKISIDININKCFFEIEYSDKVY